MKWIADVLDKFTPKERITVLVLLLVFTSFIYMGTNYFNSDKYNELNSKLIECPELIADFQEEEIINRNFFDNIILPFDIKHFTIYSKDKNTRFDNFINFNSETKNEFLNIVATKRRMLSQIVDDPQSEYQKINETLNIIISKSAKK